MKVEHHFQLQFNFREENSSYSYEIPSKLQKLGSLIDGKDIRNPPSMNISRELSSPLCKTENVQKALSPSTQYTYKLFAGW